MENEVIDFYSMRANTCLATLKAMMSNNREKKEESTISMAHESKIKSILLNTIPKKYFRCLAFR